MPNDRKMVFESKPEVIPRRKAVPVLTIAISIPICVAVRKKMLGFIRGDEMINARIALKGTPAESKLKPIGIAAYVGNGESNPKADAAMMDKNSLRVEKEIFRLLNIFRIETLSKILMTKYGDILTNNSTKFSIIRKVYVPCSKSRMCNI